MLFEITPSPNHVCDIFILEDPTVDRKTYYLDIENKVRRVRDPEYWGVPYGTPITPGMKPQGQMRLPGMPTPRATVRANIDTVRAERRETSLVGFARDQAREIETLIRRVTLNEYIPGQIGDMKNDTDRLYYEFGVYIDGVEGDENPLAASGDWLKFGSCRDIRQAAYDLLGYDVEEEEENIADPHLLSGVDPGFGQPHSKASAPYGYAYKLLQDINEAPKTEVPLWRGVKLPYSYAAELVKDLQRDETFDLPLASFAGKKETALRFGSSVLFRVVVGAKAVQGSFFSTEEDEDRYGEPEVSEMVTGGRFKVVNVKEDDEGTFIVSIRQVATFDPESGLATKMANRRWKWAFLFDSSLPALAKAEKQHKALSVLGSYEEKGVRRVRDVEYWGKPYGTIITPGMKPTGPKSPFGKLNAQRATVARSTPASVPITRKPSSGSEASVSEIESLILENPWPRHPPFPATGWEQPFDEIKLPDGREVRFIASGDSPGRGMYNGRYTMYDAETRDYMGYIDYQMLEGDPTLIAMIEVDPKYRRQGVATVLAARLLADSPQGLVAGMTTEEGDAWWQRVKGFVSPDAVSAGKKRDTVDFQEMNFRQNRYAIDNGWIVSTTDSNNPRRLKAVLAERLWERLVLDEKKVSTEELVSLISDPLLPIGDTSGNALRFIISGSEEDYRAMKTPQISKMYNYSKYPEETAKEVDRLVAVLPQKDFHVYADNDGNLQISERKHVEGKQDMLGREPFPVGTPEAEMLVGQYVIGRLIATWAATSNDDNVLSLATQEAIREEFILKKTANWHRSHDYDFYKRHGLTLRKFVRAQYDETQKTFKDMNIGGVVVYRGMGVSTDDPILEASSSLGPVTVEVVGRPASSWSTHYRTAKMFADDHAEYGVSEGVIFNTTVTAEEVLSTPLSGFGCWDENEVVILGGTRDAEMMMSMHAGHDTWGEE